MRYDFAVPTWLAITIPSVIAVAACLMWALDYSKKAHEIQKLRLELEKLRAEGERREREDSLKASGLYKPTTVEIDRIVGHAHKVTSSGLDEFLSRLGMDDLHVYRIDKKIVWLGGLLAAVIFFVLIWFMAS